MADRLEIGSTLAQRFQLMRLLGSGAVGQVWHAQDTELDNEHVALKVLNAGYLGDRQAVADLKREVLLTRRLRHPNIVALHTYWEDGDHSFVSMDYVPGTNLRQTLRRLARPMTPDEVLSWLAPEGDRTVPSG